MLQKLTSRWLVPRDQLSMAWYVLSCTRSFVLLMLHRPGYDPQVSSNLPDKIRMIRADRQGQGDLASREVPLPGMSRLELGRKALPS